MAESANINKSSPTDDSSVYPSGWSEIWNEVQDFNGWVSTFDEAQEVRKRFETASSLRFVGHRKTANFGCNSSRPVQDTAGGKLIRFADRKDGIVSCDGFPFVVLGKYTLNCIFGRDKNKAAKERAAEERDRELKGDQPRSRKRRNPRRECKKKGCPAEIIMKEVIIFPQFKSYEMIKAERNWNSKELRNALSSGKHIETECRIYIKLPSPSAHQDTHVLGPLSNGSRNPLAKEVREKIQELVAQGVCNTIKMKQHLKRFVETTLFPNAAERPVSTNTAYFPTDAIIRNHIYSTRMRLRFKRSDDGKEEKNAEIDSSYFKSYEDFGIHAEMIRDTVRTNSYRLAILRSSDALIGKVVADIGAGTGVLSCFCVQAGAKKVYAIEASAMAKQAQKVAKANGASKKIKVIQERLENIKLPGKVDAIVSEWMGHFLLYESMLNSVITARDRWLKKGGLILPNKASLYLAPITNELFYSERIGFWSSVKETFGVDMSCLESEATKSLCSAIHVEVVHGNDLLARESLLTELDLHTLTHDDLECIKSSFRFSCYGREKLCGFTAWFTVNFDPNVKGKESLTLSTSPDELCTHWRQSVMYLDKPVDVELDTIITGTIALTPGKQNRRFLNVELTYQVDDGESVTKYFSLTDGTS